MASDAVTVISLVPFPIEETKPGITPAVFQLAPAPEGGFTTLLVMNCKAGVYLDMYRPVMIVPKDSEEIAQSICFDYKKGQLGIKTGEAEPGLFWVHGDYSSKSKEKELLATHATEFTEARRLQDAWFRELVTLADDMWNRFKQRGMISKMQKIAAAHLHLERAWLLDQEVTEANSTCPVCFEKVNLKAIVCRTCNAILNEVEYKKRSFASVK